MNETLHGQEQGDSLLRQTAQRLGACIRDDDVLARISSDEFAILHTRSHFPQRNCSPLRNESCAPWIGLFSVKEGESANDREHRHRDLSDG